MKQPPLLPFETLRRVMRLARFNGTLVLVVAGALALGSASIHDVFGTALGLLIAAGGAGELHGVGLLNHGRKRGMHWLIGIQFYLLAVMLGYVGWSLRHVDLASYQAALARSPELQQVVASRGLDTDSFLRQTYTYGYLALGGLTVLYQCAMALYYGRRKRAVDTALRDLDVIVE